MNYRVFGGNKLSGKVQTNISKNAAVALLAASLLNRGQTTLKRMPRIEEVRRLVEVLRSIGVSIDWDQETGDMKIETPETFALDRIDREAAAKTRSIALFMAPLAHRIGSFAIPQPGGCQLGNRSMSAHERALAQLGIRFKPNGDALYHVETGTLAPADIVMPEASDTGVENVLMAAALIPGKTTIRFASANYMVQDLCAFLETLGVKIEGIGTATLVVHGIERIETEAIGFPSEDPIESMFFISLAATTGSTFTVTRCPIDFLELELLTLEEMGVAHTRSNVYFAENGAMRLVDIKVQPAQTLTAPAEKIAPRPYPGINIDNLPFFVPVATQAEGRTLIHDWVYENRAIYYAEMERLGADVVLADPHRVFITGPSKLTPADMTAPPALRPATVLLIGMLAADGESILRGVYSINRGYENLHERLGALGAHIEAFEDTAA